MFDFAIKSSIVREHFSEIVDDVIRRQPKVVNRHRDHFVMMNFDHVSAFIDDLKFRVTVIRDDDGTYLASSEEIDDLIGQGHTPDASVRSLVDELIEYSDEYMRESFELYFKAPNRKKHFPYVFKVMMQRSPDEVMKLLHVQHQGS